MRSGRSVAVGALLMALALPGLPRPVRADFVDTEVGARAMSMGGAFVAMSGDPASLYWNAAAILSENRVQVEAMRTSLYDGVEGLTEDYLGTTLQISPRLAVGLGWTRTGLEDLYHEDVLNGTVAFEVLPDRLSVGATGLVYGASAPGYEDLNDPNYLGAQWKPSVSLGALYRLGEEWQFGASFENLLRPEIQLVSTTGDVDQIGGRRRFGAAYLLQGIVWLAGEVRHDDIPAYVDRAWTFHLGAESWFQDTLALRVGLDDDELSAGAGLKVKAVRVDVTLLTHERLGNTYRAGVTLSF
jgi:hypothetical protein